MDRKTTQQITLWVRRNLLDGLDEFYKKHGYASRSKFIIDAMQIVYNNPSLLKHRKVEPQIRLLQKYVLAFEEYGKTQKIPKITLDNEETFIYDEIIKRGLESAKNTKKTNLQRADGV